MRQPPKKLLDDFEIVWLTEDQLSKDITNLTKQAPTGISPDRIYVGRFAPNGRLDTNLVPGNQLLTFMKSVRTSDGLPRNSCDFF